MLGNQTIVLNTSTGIWASSENVIAAKCLTPEHSRMPDLARWSRTWGQEVVLNAQGDHPLVITEEICLKGLLPAFATVH